MNSKSLLTRLALIAVACLLAGRSFADVTQSYEDGFVITIVRTTTLSPDKAYSRFVDDFASWYDASHSYTEDAKNLSLDLEKQCMLEKLPDGGFVRHMEIAIHQPGVMLRLTGGLGPLQRRGVSGALTVNFRKVDEKTEVAMSYYVCGAKFLQLPMIAEPVDQVLTGQMDRFKTFCESSPE